MRLLNQVIEEIVAVVPSEEHYLLAGFRSIQSSFEIAAPEMHRFWWGEAARLLATTFPDAEDWSDWHRKVADIWRNKEPV
jgi:hypothetical protein